VGSRRNALPCSDRQYDDPVNTKGVQGSARTNDVCKCIICADLVEMGVLTVYLFFGPIDTLKYTAGHGECVCRDSPGCSVKAFHDLSKSPGSKGSTGPDFHCLYTGAFNCCNAGPGGHRPHRPHNKTPVCPRVKECPCDHVARSAVERIKNQDSHLQYL
jgi:hypothetical protein